MSIVSPIKTRFLRGYTQWLDRRVPRAKSVTLDQRRVFIFPSRTGFWFLATLLLMLIAAINFQNSMAFALVFLLASLFVVAILHTFSNLSGLSITGVRSSSAFAGDRVELELLVSRNNTRHYYDVSFYWGEGVADIVTLKECSEVSIKLHLPAIKRGVFIPNRLLVETFYPLGLLRAWTWIALDLEALIYPAPLSCQLPLATVSANDSGDVTAVIGSDDFYDFKAYQAGDSLKHVFWKSYARGLALQTKHYQSYAEKRLWLDWYLFTGDVELRLSRLCFWVIKLADGTDEFGLRLPNVEIQPSSGEKHRALVLKELALFSLSSVSAQ